MCRVEFSGILYNKTPHIFCLLSYKWGYMIWDGCGISVAIPEIYEEQELYVAPEKTCFKHYWIINLILPVTVGFFSSLDLFPWQFVEPCPGFYRHLFFAPLFLWRTKLNVCWCKFSLLDYSLSFCSPNRGYSFVLYFENTFWFYREHQQGNSSVAGFIKKVGVELEYRQRKLLGWFNWSCLPTCRKGGFETQPREGDAHQ